MQNDETNLQREFLAPRCTISNLDLYVVRSSILRDLKNTLPYMKGTVLDVGCGFMPYKPLFTDLHGQVQEYVGLDLKDNTYQKPDIEWDGEHIPLNNASIDSALATEVFEHCPDPELVMCEIFRVLKPGGIFFFTVPFLWPLHCTPYDEYRYTPFSLNRHLSAAGFSGIKLKGLGGWDASLAQMIGLWVCRRGGLRHKRRILSAFALPIIQFLMRRDNPPQTFEDNTFITGISGIAFKQ